ncbi:MAG: hypothetical protein ACREBR_00650, partial [bacterium]
MKKRKSYESVEQGKGSTMTPRSGSKGSLSSEDDYLLTPRRSARRKLAHEFTLKQANLMKKRAAPSRAIKTGDVVGIPISTCDRSKLSVTNMTAVVLECCEKGLALGISEGRLKGFYAPSTVRL